MKTKILLLTIAVALPASWTFAQNADGPPRPPGAPRDGDRRPVPMPMPFLHVLDKDDDGIISADEIKGSSDALKKLDKNNDGQLTRDEWQPQPPRPPQGERPAGSRDGERKTGPRDGERPRSGPRDGEARPGAVKPPGDAPGKGERPPGAPASPLLEALDTDRDGIISADEIGKAPESLAKLDLNNDGQLGPREYGPRPPQGPPPREGAKDSAK